MSPEQPEDTGVRRVLGGLPPVDPPPGFLPGLVRRTRLRADSLVASGLAVAFVVLTVGVAAESGVDEHDVEPRLERLLDQHEAAMGPGSGQVGGFERTDTEELGAPYWAPTDLAGSFHAMGAFVDEDLAQVAYRSGSTELSVFEEPGDLDRSAMRRQHLDRLDGSAWMMADDHLVVVVVEREDMVYTVVGDAEPAEMTAMVERLPGSRSLGLADRLREAADDALDLFALG